MTLDEANIQVVPTESDKGKVIDLSPSATEDEWEEQDVSADLHDACVLLAKWRKMAVVFDIPDVQKALGVVNLRAMKAITKYTKDYLDCFDEWMEDD